MLTDYQPQKAILPYGILRVSTSRTFSAGKKRLTDQPMTEKRSYKCHFLTEIMRAYMKRPLATSIQGLQFQWKDKF